MKSPVAKTWRLAETQECVSTGGFRVVCLSRLGVAWFVETWRAASPVIGNAGGISVSSAKSCRDAFLRLGTRDCRMKSPVAKTWRLAETQECVSTGFLRVCLSRLGVAWRLGETQECVSTGGFRVVCLLRLGVVWFVETWRAASPVIGAVRGISVSSAKSCRDAFSRLGTRDCRMKSPVAKTWRLAETQECVSTGGFRVVCLSRLGVAWRLGETQECVSTGGVSHGLSFASWRCLAAWGDARMRLYRGFRVVCLSRLGMRRGDAARGSRMASPRVCLGACGDYSSPLGLSSGGVTGSSLPSSPPPGWPGLSSSLSESPLAPPWPAEVSGAFDFWPMTSRL